MLLRDEFLDQDDVKRIAIRAAFPSALTECLGTRLNVSSLSLEGSADDAESRRLSRVHRAVYVER